MSNYRMDIEGLQQRPAPIFNRDFSFFDKSREIDLPAIVSEHAIDAFIATVEAEQPFQKGIRAWACRQIVEQLIGDAEHPAHSEWLATARKLMFAELDYEGNGEPFVALGRVFAQHNDVFRARQCYEYAFVGAYSQAGRLHGPDWVSLRQRALQLSGGSTEAFDLGIRAQANYYGDPYRPKHPGAVRHNPQGWDALADYYTFFAPKPDIYKAASAREIAVILRRVDDPFELLELASAKRAASDSHQAIAGRSCCCTRGFS